MTFNWEISIGSLLAMFTVAGGFASFYFGTRYDMRSLKEVLGAGMIKLDKSIETMHEVMTKLALSTQRQDNYERRTDETFTQMKEEIRELRKQVKT